MKRNQRTIKNSIEADGVGLHTGAKVHLKASPGDPDTGLVFIRTDLPDEDPIPATFQYVDENPRRTTLRNGKAEVNTVEHLCAAMMGLGIDNLEVELDGPEIPGMDGSALPFFSLLQDAGVVEQKVPRRLYEITESLAFAVGDSSLAIAPHDGESLTLSYTLDYPNTSVGSQFFSVDVNEEAFREKIAPARTFCFEAEVEELRKNGLGLGADTQNTLVIRNGSVVENQLRFNDEFVRHKILDLMGDLFLCGVDLKGRIMATKTGHAANRMLVKELVARVEEEENASNVVPSGMEIKEILNLLPHRYPFLLIDRVIKLEGYRRAVGIKNVTINEPFFQGHWPEQPVMPGVLILEAMAQLAGLLLLRRLENTGKLAVLWSIDKVKLRRAVGPGDQLRIEIEATKVRSKMGQGAATAKVGRHKVAQALLTFTLVDAT